LALDEILQLARIFVAGAVGFALLWYDWKRNEKRFRQIIREEIERAFTEHGFIKIGEREIDRLDNRH
jgi:hypothetical protein